jgi:hypothetical protein
MPSGLALPMATALDRPVAFDKDVRPVLDGRCAVLPWLLRPPCQLLLTSSAGSAARRLRCPSRFEANRRRAPYAARCRCADRGGVAHQGILQRHRLTPDSLLLRMLALGRAHRSSRGRLPELVKLDINRALTCSTGEGFEDYAKKQPLGGMPYGVTPLSQDDLQVLVSWVAQGAQPAAEPPPLAPAVAAELKTWEAFLNGTSLKQRVVSRYLYEHWFVAHLYFDVVEEPVLQGRPLAHRAGPADRRDRHGSPLRRPRRGVLVPAAADPREHRAQDAHRVFARAEAARAAARAVPRR